MFFVDRMIWPPNIFLLFFVWEGAAYLPDYFDSAKIVVIVWSKWLHQSHLEVNADRYDLDEGIPQLSVSSSSPRLLPLGFLVLLSIGHNWQTGGHEKGLLPARSRRCHCLLPLSRFLNCIWSATEMWKIIHACLKVPASVQPGNLASPAANFGKLKLNSRNFEGIILHDSLHLSGI